MLTKVKDALSRCVKDALSLAAASKVVPKVFQEGECCLEGLINLPCGLQLQILSRLNGHFMNVLVWWLLASVLSSHVRFQILDSSYHFN